MRWSRTVAVFVTAALCVTGCASAPEHRRATTTTIGYPQEHVECGTISGARDLRWRDFELLMARAKALGLHAETRYYSYSSTTGSSTTGSGTTANTGLVTNTRSPSARAVSPAAGRKEIEPQASIPIIAAASNPKFREICTHGKGTPTVPITLLNDTIEYGPQRTPADARHGTLVSRTAIEAFIARQYDVRDVVCNRGTDFQTDPRVRSGIGPTCRSDSWTFMVFFTGSGRTFEVVPLRRFVRR